MADTPSEISSIDTLGSEASLASSVLDEGEDERGSEDQPRDLTNATVDFTKIEEPRTVEELQALIHRADKISVYSKSRGFATIADTSGTLVSLDDMAWDESSLQLDQQKRRVACSAFMSCAALAKWLEDRGWALNNLPSSLNLSVGDAIATAAHGSGDGCSMLTTSVVAVDYVDADGCLVATTETDLASSSLGSATDPALQAVLLGGLGVLVEVTLRIEPSFLIRQDVYLNLSWAPFWKEAPTFTGTGNVITLAYMDEAALIDDIFCEAYSVSVFIGDWCSDYISQAWFKRKVPWTPDGRMGALPSAAPELFGGRLARSSVHPMKDAPASACTLQGEPAGPSSTRLPHFESSTQGDDAQLRSEYFVPREHAVDALRALRKIAIIIQGVLKVTELRTVAADEFWMSPHYRRPSFAIQFVWDCNVKTALKTLLHIENALKPFAPRPSWDSLFISFGPEIPSAFAKSEKYRVLLASLDPKGKFRSQYIDRFVFGNHRPGQGPLPPGSPGSPNSAQAISYGNAVRGVPRPYDLLRRPPRIGGVAEDPPAADADAAIQAVRQRNKVRIENGRLGWKFGLPQENGTDGYP